MLFSEIEMRSQATLDCLIIRKEEKQDKNGKSFGFFVLSDGEKQIEARMWEDPKTVPYDEGYVCAVKLKKEEYLGKENFTILEINNKLNNNLTIEDFIVNPPYDVNMMFDYLMNLLKSFADPNQRAGYEPISSIAVSILTRKEEAFKKASAAVSMHHNCRGGLLWHTYEMTLLAEKFCEVFDFLDKELLITGTVLHDIGKLVSYDTNDFGDTTTNSYESLIGHLTIGANAILAESSHHHCSKEKVNLLTHMILSHHGLPEYGAVVTPTTTEAYILSQIDNIDSRIFMFRNAQEGLEPGQMSDKKIFGIDTRVYRPKD